MTYTDAAHVHDAETVLMTGRAQGKPDQVEVVAPYTLGYYAMVNHLVREGYRDIYVGEMQVFQVMPFVRRDHRGLTTDSEFIAWVLEMKARGVTNAKIAWNSGTDWSIIREIVKKAEANQMSETRLCTHPDCDRPRWYGPNGTNTKTTLCEDHQREYWRVKAAEKAAKVRELRVSQGLSPQQKPGRKSATSADANTPAPSRAARESVRCTAEGCPNERYIDDSGRMLNTCEKHSTSKGKAASVKPSATSSRTVPNTLAAHSVEGSADEQYLHTGALQPRRSPFFVSPPDAPPSPAAKKPEAAKPAPQPSRQPSASIRELVEETVAVDVPLETSDSDEYLVVHNDGYLASIDAAYERIHALYR